MDERMDRVEASKAAEEFVNSLGLGHDIEIGIDDRRSLEDIKRAMTEQDGDPSDRSLGRIAGKSVSLNPLPNVSS